MKKLDNNIYDVQHKYIPDSNERYKISIYGNIFDLNTNRTIKQGNKKNKLCVYIWLNNKLVKRSVDILVCEIFVRPLDKNEVVIHKDENLKNNNLDNLVIKKANEPKYIKDPPKLENEEWKDIKNYENRYMVSTKGKIYSQFDNRIMTLYCGEIGYYVVNLINDKGKRDLYLVHILVAEQFIGVISKGNVIDHIDRNKLNNEVSNLRIVSRSINGKNREFKTLNVIQKYDLQNNLIKEYDSIEEIKKDLNITTRPRLNYVLHNKRKTAYGFIWKYKNKREIKLLDNNFTKLGIINGIDFSHYGINKQEQIFSYKTNKIMKTRKLGGYLSINLRVNNKSYPLRIHRLLIQTFGEDMIENKIIVNHIDENKLNNNLDNLEWVNYKENSIHSRGKKVKQIDIKTNECIKVFSSVNDAYNELNVKYGSNIRMVCNGKRVSAYGYKWKWE